MRGIATTMMRVRKDIHTTLHDLATQEHVSMQDVLEKSLKVYATLHDFAREEHTSPDEVLAETLDTYRRHRLLEETNKAYAALRANPELWSELQEERRALEGGMSGRLDRTNEFAGW